MLPLKHHGTVLDDAELSLLEGIRPDLLIGDWRPAEQDRRFAVHDPSTGAFLKAVADASATDALDALAVAHTAGPAWAATSPTERADLLWALHAELLRRADEIARLITLEMGKPLQEACGEIRYGAGYLRWYAEEAMRVGGRTQLSPDGHSSITTGREPVGPCLLITPWNFPLAMALRKIAPALAAGCTCVLKPAELTPLTALAFGQVLVDAGAPAGVVNIVTTTDPGALSAALMGDPRLRKVSFTGSTAVGRTLLAQAAPNVLRTSMELGGNAPLLVFDDADLDRTVDGAVTAKLRNGGQSCVAANRILVQEGIADRLIERFVQRLDAVVVGPGSDPATTLGPLIDDRALARLTRLVDEAQAAGARLLCGGGTVDLPGSYLEPTALEITDPDAPILHHELFGPVAPIIRFSTEQDGLELANRTPFGLAAYVFSEGADRIERAVAGLQAGMIGVNQGLVSNVAAPFGGIKHSGLGREGGPEGIEEYLDVKYVTRPLPQRG